MKSQNNTGNQKNTQKNYKRSRPYSSGMSTRLHLKNHGLIILKMNSKEEKTVIGLKTMVLTLMLLGLITCTCSGPRLILGSQNSGSPIEYSVLS